jgi:hypothetical protein
VVKEQYKIQDFFSSPKKQKKSEESSEEPSTSTKVTENQPPGFEILVESAETEVALVSTHCPVLNVHQIFNLKVTSYQTQSPTLVEMMKNLPNLTNDCWTKISKVKKKSHRFTNNLQDQEIFHKMLLMDPRNQS